MTEQYQQQSINGQPSALSLRVTPLAPPIAGATDTEAIFWPSLAADAVIVGSGLSVAGSAAVGSIIEVSEPGLYQVSWTLVDLAAPASTPINIVRGASVPITGGNGYPAVDPVAGTPLGVEQVSFTPVVTPPENKIFGAVFRVTGEDLEDAGAVVNPNRQIRFSALGGAIVGFAPPGTQIDINRISR